MWLGSCLVVHKPLQGQAVCPPPSCLSSTAGEYGWSFLLSCWRLLPLVQARQKLHVLVALQLLAAAGQAQPRSKLDLSLCTVWLGWEKLQGVGKERCGLFEVTVTSVPTRSCRFPSVALGRVSKYWRAGPGKGMVLPLGQDGAALRTPAPWVAKGHGSAPAPPWSLCSTASQNQGLASGFCI